MRQASFPIPALLLVICTSLIASCANPSNNNSSSQSSATNAANSGQLVINPSPVLGDNVFITIRIDGEVAGTLMPTGTFNRSLKPGRHVLAASPNKNADGWQGTLDVRPGQTYSYVAAFNVTKLVLTRVTDSR